MYDRTYRSSVSTSVRPPAWHPCSCRSNMMSQHNGPKRLEMCLALLCHPYCLNLPANTNTHNQHQHTLSSDCHTHLSTASDAAVLKQQQHDVAASQTNNHAMWGDFWHHQQAPCLLHTPQRATAAAAAAAQSSHPACGVDASRAGPGGQRERIRCRTCITGS